MTLNIYIKYDKEKVRLPVLPSEFEMSATQGNTTVVIHDFGEINLKGDRGLYSISLSSFFPSEHYYFCKCKPKTPSKYIKIFKELFEKNKQNITNVKKSYLYSHPLQEQEKMIESYVLFGRCTYQDSNEKTVSLLKKAFILSEGSVQDYYKSIERLVHYEKKNDFCSNSKYILRDINSR